VFHVNGLVQTHGQPGAARKDQRGLRCRRRFRRRLVCWCLVRGHGGIGRRGGRDSRRACADRGRRCLPGRNGGGFVGASGKHEGKRGGQNRKRGNGSPAIGGIVHRERLKGKGYLEPRGKGCDTFVLVDWAAMK